jgi:hypothetical protein
MKNRMLILLAGLFLMAHAGFAQTKTSFGIRAGVNFQNLNGEDMDGDDLDFKMKTGFHIGVDADIPIAPEFYFRPGVLFSTKGAKFDDDADTKLNLSYIEVPLNFVYKPTLGTGKLILGLGPYVAYAVGGKIKDDDDNEADIEFENEITVQQALSGTPYLKGLDFGGNLLFGYEFSQKFYAQLNAQLGLSNINPKIEGVDDDDRGKTKNTGFGVSLGYRF